MSVVFGWGKNATGALGIRGSERDSIPHPSQIKELDNKDIVKISSGEGHTLVTLRDGRVLSCGSNDFSQCGRELHLTKLEPIEAGLNSHCVLVACTGSSHSVALTQAHEIMTWGKNNEGQLGRGDVPEELLGKPKLVKSLAVYSIVQVACGNNHNIVLTSEGLIGVWGSNSYGQLGLGPNSGQGRDTPDFVNCLKGIPVMQVTAGGNHSTILSKSGAIYNWGRNSFGQLGLNDVEDRSSPSLCRPLRGQKIKYISSGENHSAALTADGRVFTFGAGSYGQLGHNSFNNEILPKQIIELSGSQVSQITCGRGHTLAYVPKVGRLYAFGQGGSGQLGINSTENKNSPFHVKSPWVSAGSSSMQVDNETPLLSLKHAFCGGDRSFVIAQDSTTCQPDDFRERDSASQILSLSSRELETWRSLQTSEVPPHEVSDEIAKIFSSSCCLNGSFLLPDKEHFGSSRKKHGVDMSAVRTFFQGLATIPNINILQKISAALEQCLLPMLPSSPPDVEALRLYLMLPECHLMDNPKYYYSIICPFASSLLSLDKVALKTFDFWWAANQPSHFNRLVTIYKQCIQYLLHLPDTNSLLEVKKRQKGLFTSMEMLQKLNQVNEDQSQIIAYHKFYVPELKEKVNIRNDYINWVQQTQQQHQVGGVLVQGLHFCNYPFLFDGAAKSVLLQTDAAMQMQHAIENAQRRNLMNMFSGLGSPQMFDPVNPCLVLFVSRNNLVQDTLIQLQSKHADEFKKPLKVVFLGEEAVDEGGVRKEFLMLLLKEVMDPKYGMFVLHEGSNLQWFNPMTFEDPAMFHMIGILCGLAIYNFTIIDLHFPLALYKKLLKKPVILDDLKELKPGVGKGLQDVLDYEGNDFEDTFSLTFEIMREHFGETKSVDLCPDGANKEVNQSNKQEYVNLFINEVLNTSVEVQFNAFNDGFHSVCGGRVLELFHPSELQAMVVGNEDYDFHELEKNTEYKGEYHRYHPTIKLFWQVFHEMTLENKKKFLSFLTGSDRIPVFGMKNVKMIIQPTGGGTDYLPVAHTCFNLLDLPKYDSKDLMENKLQLAVQQTEGFGLV